MFDKSARQDGTFSREDFRYDREGNVYFCPAGKMLSTRGSVLNDDQVMYWSSTYDCAACSLKQRCCPDKPSRRVPRSIHEGAGDMARDIARTDACTVWRRQRKKVEVLFAHLNRVLRLDRLRLRGPSGARDEFHLAAAAQNLRELARLIPAPVTAA